MLHTTMPIIHAPPNTTQLDNSTSKKKNHDFKFSSRNNYVTRDAGVYDVYELGPYFTMKTEVEECFDPTQSPVRTVS